MNTISGRDDAEWRKLDKLQTSSYANPVKKKAESSFKKDYLAKN